MKWFRFTAKWTTTRSIEVQAETEDEAREKLLNQDQDSIYLDPVVSDVELELANKRDE